MTQKPRRKAVPHFDRESTQTTNPKRTHTHPKNVKFQHGVPIYDVDKSTWNFHRQNGLSIGVRLLRRSALINKFRSYLPAGLKYDEFQFGSCFLIRFFFYLVSQYAFYYFLSLTSSLSILLDLIFFTVNQILFIIFAKTSSNVQTIILAIIQTNFKYFTNLNISFNNYRFICMYS